MELAQGGPAWMLWAPSMTAFMPDAHTLLMVQHTVDCGRPAPRAACRAGACNISLPCQPRLFQTSFAAGHHDQVRIRITMRA